MIYALGDSLTYGHGLKREDAWPSLLEKIISKKVLNRGISGDTTAGMLARFAARDEKEVKKLIFIGGSNDIVMGIPIDLIMYNIRTIVYQAVDSRMKITIGLPIKPSNDAKAFGGLPLSVNENLKRERENLKRELEIFSESNYFNLIDLEEVIESDPKYYLDSLHLNKLGNEKLAKFFAENI